MASRTCGGCARFDKDAFRHNPTFGVCRAEFELPALPLWLSQLLPDTRQRSAQRFIANYNAADLCATWEQRT